MYNRVGMSQHLFRLKGEHSRINDMRFESFFLRVFVSGQKVVQENHYA